MHHTFNWKTTTKGHCQLCGKKVKVRDGVILSHGWEWYRTDRIKHTCPGSYAHPIEDDTTLLLKTLKDLSQDVLVWRQQIEYTIKHRPAIFMPNQGCTGQTFKVENREPIYYAALEWFKSSHYDKIDNAEKRIRQLMNLLKQFNPIGWESIEQKEDALQ